MNSFAFSISSDGDAVSNRLNRCRYPSFRKADDAVMVRLFLAVVMALGPGAVWAADRPQERPVEVAFEAARSAMMTDPEQALRSARAAQSLLDRAPRTTQTAIDQATAEWLAGEALARLGNLDAAGEHIRRGLSAVERLEPRGKLHADLLMSQGAIAVDQGRVSVALQSFETALAIFRERRLTRSQALALQSIANIYSNAGDQKRVLRYLAQAQETYSADPALASANHNALGTAYKELGELARAEREYRSAFALNRQMDSPLLEARVLTNLASVQLKRGELAAAGRTVDAGLALTRDPSAHEWLPFLWGVKGQIAAARGDFITAAADLDRAFAGQSLETTSFFFRDFHETAADVFARLDRDALALAHLRALKRLDDEAREIRSSTNLALMSAQFDYSNQELRISRLKEGQLQRDITIARANARMQWGLMSGLAVLLAVATIGFLTVRRSRNQTRVANVALSKALKAKSEFLATTSHEIRTPLNGILGMTQVLLAGGKLDDATRGRIEVVDSAGHTMKAVVDDILDMARIESGRIELEESDFDLHAVLADSARLWTARAESKGLTLKTDWSAAPRRVHADRRKLCQVISNLVSNAIKFTDEGHVALDAVAEDNRLRITVRDTGIGIPHDQLVPIFDAFHQVEGGTTRRFSGTGLGLAICRNLTEAMGGHLAVTSEMGTGSSFTIDLPLPEGATRAAPVEESASASIFLVEANPIQRSLISALIGDIAPVVPVASLAEAAASAQGAPPVALIVDWAAVEQEADGRERLAELRRGAPDIVILVMTEDLATVDGGLVTQALPRQMPPFHLAPALRALLPTSVEDRAAA